MTLPFVFQPSAIRQMQHSGKKGPEMVKTNTPIICLRQISAVFSDMQVLSHVDLAIYPGEFHGIIGKNGAGKTVLANILSGNRKPDQGEVLLDGTPVRFKNQADAFRHGIVFSPQHLALLENRTVFDNLSGPDTIRACFGAQKRECEQRISEALSASRSCPDMLPPARCSGRSHICRTNGKRTCSSPA